MRVHLMHAGRDFELDAELPANAESLAADLELPSLLEAMAAGDQFLRKVAETALLHGLADPEEIVYRQRVLADCIEHPDVIRELYALALQGVEARRHAFGFLSDSPDSILSRSRGALEYLLDTLRALRALIERAAPGFRSEGFARLFERITDELDAAYLERVEAQIAELGFRHGVLMSGRLGPGNRGAGYVLRRPGPRGLFSRVAGAVRRPRLSFEIPPRDEAGSRSLAELRGSGINLVANALAQSTDHVIAFFGVLRTELAFYLGCLNLHARLTAKSEPLCFPAAVGAGERAFSARGLYDPSLSLHLPAPTVGNDVDADGRALLVITGANQGGKSTFLRSAGLARLMAQSGMFVAAEAMRVSVGRRLFTHFKREEDASMRRGKLDEELARMSEIADQVSPGALLLMNESFASTNEREGSEIAREVVRALIDAGVGVLYVTHLYELAHTLHSEDGDDVLFLRAERLADGQRTFRIREGEPLPTSHGQDTFRRVFGESLEPAARGRR
jgi:hypothetical protein